MPSPDTPPLDQMAVLAPLLSEVVTSISPDQLDRQTPCASFTVRGVLDHMVGGATAFTREFGGTPPAPSGDPLADFPAVLGSLGEAIGAPGALDKVVEAPFGPTPGETFVRFIVLDGLVHGWDLAQATGQSYDPPVDLVAAVDAFARDAIDPLRDGDTFADPAAAPDDASPIERLVAFTGRRVTRH